MDVYCVGCFVDRLYKVGLEDIIDITGLTHEEVEDVKTRTPES